MQTPAPFEYERATSVEGAIASLQRLGSEARIIAGGHSLLPMMKLRLANPEHLIDINDLAELVLHPRAGRRDPDRRADAARRPAEVRAARPALPALPRRRERDRRPGRAQPRHDRRLALPGRRGRGPVGRLLGGQGEGRDPRRRRRARRRDGGLPRRAVHDRGRRRRDADRDPARRSARARGSAHEKVERRAGDWAIAAASAAVWIERRHDRRRGHRAQRGRADDDPPHARRGAAARQGAVGGAVRAGGRDRLGGLLAERRRPRAGRLQAPPRRRAHDSARCAARPRARSHQEA